MPDDPSLELSDDARVLLSLLPADGRGRGNTVLRDELGWEEDRYLAARNELLDAGMARRGRGRGGSLRLVSGIASDATTEAPAEVEEYEAERDLYQPLSVEIERRWAKDARLDPAEAVVAITGYQGKRPTGGRWSRPDIVLVAVTQFMLVPGKHLNVVTFEVKRGPALDVTAVYEALSHRRAATQAYVLVHGLDLQEDALDIVEVEASRHGIGLIVAEDPADYDTWDTRVDAEQVPAEPSELDSFLRTQLPAHDRERVAHMVR